MPADGAPPPPDRGRRSDVLRVLKEAAAPLSIVEVAVQLGLHPNTVRFHLDTLVESGQVEHTPPARGGPGRPSLLFRAPRRMSPTGPRHYRLLAEVLTQGLVDSPRTRARSLEAGRAWGRRIAGSALDGDDTGAPGRDEPIERLVTLLEGLGFAPERRESDAQVWLGLRHCPFLELAELHGQVVCLIHLGLMQGVMESWGASATVDRLDAFVEPDLCLAHVVRGAAG